MALQFNLSESNATVLAQIEGDPGAVRLDADLYHVDDVHGGTESLSGSGNLNYLVLQSRQPGDALQAAGYGSRGEGIGLDTIGGASGFGGHGQAGGNSPNWYTAGGATGGTEADHTAQIFGSALNAAPVELLTATSALASGLSTSNGTIGAQNILSPSGNQYGGGSNDTQLESLLSQNGTAPAGPAGSDGSNGANGNSGGNGMNGSDGGNGTGTGGHCGDGGGSGGGTGGHCDGGAEGGITLNLLTTLGNVNLTVLDPVDRLLDHLGLTIDGKLDLAPLLDHGQLPGVDVSVDSTLHGEPILNLDTASLTDPLTTDANAILNTLDPVTQPILNTVASAGDTLGLLPTHGGAENGIIITPDIHALDLPLATGAIDIPLPSISGAPDIDLTLHPTAGLLDSGALADAGLTGLFDGTSLPSLSLPGNGDGLDLGSLSPTSGSGSGGDCGCDPLAGITQTVQSVVNDASSLAETAPGHAASAIGDLLGAATGDTGTLLADAGGTATSAGTGLIGAVTSDTGTLASSVVSAGGEAASTVTNNAGTLLGDAGHAVDTTGSTVADDGSHLVQSLTGAATGGADSAISGITDTALTTGGDLADGAGATLGNVNSGVSSTASSIADTAQDLTNPVTHDSGGLDITVNAGAQVANTVGADTGATVSATPGGLDIGAGAGADVLHNAATPEVGTSVSADPGEGLLQDLANNLLGPVSGGAGAVESTPLTSALPNATGEVGSGSALAGTDLSSHTSGTDSASWPVAGSSAGTQVASTGTTSSLPDPVGHVSEGLGSVVDHSHTAVHHVGLLG
jgi:hypothetical protein